MSVPHAHLVLEDGGDVCTVEVCDRATNRSELLRHGAGGGPDARRRPLELRRGVRYALEPGDRLRLGLLECSVVFGEAYEQQRQGQEQPGQEQQGQGQEQPGQEQPGQEQPGQEQPGQEQQGQEQQGRGQQGQEAGQEPGPVEQQEVGGPAVASAATAGAGLGAALDGRGLEGAKVFGGGTQVPGRVSVPPTQEVADWGALQPAADTAGAAAAVVGDTGEPGSAAGAGAGVAVEQEHQGVSPMVQVVVMVPGGQLVSLPAVAGPGGLTLLGAPPGGAGPAVATDNASAATTAVAAGLAVAHMPLPLPLPLGGVGGILGVLPPQAAALASVPGLMPPPHLAAVEQGLGVGPAGEQLPAPLQLPVPPLPQALLLEALRLQQQQQQQQQQGVFGAGQVHVQGQMQQQYLSLGSSGTSESGVSETPEGTQHTQQGARQQAAPTAVEAGATGSAGGAVAAGPDGTAPAGGASMPGGWWDEPDSMDDVHYGSG